MKENSKKKFAICNEQSCQWSRLHDAVFRIYRTSTRFSGNFGRGVQKFRMGVIFKLWDIEMSAPFVFYNY